MRSRRIASGLEALLPEPLLSGTTLRRALLRGLLVGVALLTLALTGLAAGAGSGGGWSALFAFLLGLLATPLSLAEFAVLRTRPRSPLRAGLAAGGLVGLLALLGVLSLVVVLSYAWELVSLGAVSGAVAQAGGAASVWRGAWPEVLTVAAAVALPAGLVAATAVIRPLTVARGLPALALGTAVFVGLQLALGVRGWPELSWLLRMGWYDGRVDPVVFLAPVLLPILIPAAARLADALEERWLARAAGVRGSLSDTGPLT